MSESIRSVDLCERDTNGAEPQGDEMTGPGCNRSVPLGEIEQHFWLTRSVARVMGVNFSEAMAEERMSREDYSELVTQCRAAGCAHDCTAWLAEQTGQTGEAPAFCANAAFLNALRHAGQKPDVPLGWWRRTGRSN